MDTSKYFGTINLPVETKVLALINGKIVGNTLVVLEDEITLYRLSITGGFLDGMQVSFKANNQVVGNSIFLSGGNTKVNLVFLTANTIKR